MVDAGVQELKHFTLMLLFLQLPFGCDVSELKHATLRFFVADFKSFYEKLPRLVFGLTVVVDCGVYQGVCFCCAGSLRGAYKLF